MTDHNYVNKFMNALTGGERWLQSCLKNPRLAQHGADPWCIDIDINDTPVIFSFKFRQNKLSCCIILRHRQSATAFEVRIKELYGQRFEEVGIGIAGIGNEVYFKPFGTMMNVKTRDVFFEVDSPPNLENQAQVNPCHEMPDGGRTCLRAAVIRVLNHFGFSSQQHDSGILPVVAPAVAAPVGLDLPEEISDTTLCAAEIFSYSSPPAPTLPLVNQIMHFMHGHCTGSGTVKSENQRKLVTELKTLLELTTLQSRSEEQLWSLMWEKPIYANQNNNIATQVVQRCRHSKVFDDYKKIPKDSVSLQGLRDPVEKLERIRRISTVFNQIYALYNATLEQVGNPENIHLVQNSQAEDFDSLRIMIGALSDSKVHRVGIYPVVNKLNGFGGITELHMLVDFGFPVCKPDIWIVRTVISFLNIHNGNRPDLLEFIRQKHPEFKLADLRQKLLNRKHQYSFRVLDYIVKYELDFTDPFFNENGIDPTIRFRGHRLADLIVAKFGMTAEDRFGLVCSPMDKLNSDRTLAESYPELAQLANELRRQKNQG